MVFRYKSDMNGLRIGLPFFEPEKISFAITKTFQVWVSVFAFVVYKGCDPKWLQSLGIESELTPEVTGCENKVVDHIFLFCFRWYRPEGSMVLPSPSEPYASLGVS